jgi:aryl-alcohol dehydrogenase-like predicted oxidoreductase
MKKEKTLTRRKFLVRAAQGATSMAALPLIGVGRLEAQDKADGGKPDQAGKKPVTRVLGRTGIEVPIVNMGVMNADNPALVRRAFEAGMRLFDTAAYYQRGRNEEMVGSVLQELKARDQAVIVTKVFLPPPQRELPAQQVRDFFLKTAEESLRRLKTDHVDVLHAHNVWTVDYLKNPGVLEALQLLKKQGKTRFVGFTTHQAMAECLDAAAGMGFYDVAMTSFNYSFHDDAPLHRAMAKAAAAGIGVVAMKTQCQQDWYREGMPAELQGFYGGKIMHSALLKWALNHDFVACVVPGFVTFPQLEEDWACAFGIEYTPEEKSFLEARGVKLAMAAACRQCGACAATCPRGADVPELVRAHMYAFSYGNPGHARRTLDGIPADRGLGLCKDCGDCRAGCTGKVQIARRIGQLKEAYA